MTLGVEDLAGPLDNRVLAAPREIDPATGLVAGANVLDEASGWLFTPVGARGEDWGRVIVVCDGPPGGTDTVLIERAATTLARGGRPGCGRLRPTAVLPAG